MGGNGSKDIVVVAGATGYLGRYVVRELHRRGWRVRALARDPERLGEARRFCDEVFVGQATRKQTLEGLFDGAQAAFSSIGVRHFRPRPTFREVDYGANRNLVELACAAGVERFVFVSVLHGAEMRALSPVVEAREQVVDLLRASPLQATILRPTAFFNDMAEVLRLARRGRVWLIGSGRSRLNPIHGADLAVVAAEALEAEPVQAEVAAGGPEVFTQRELAELAFRVLGRPPRYGHLPPRLLHLLAVLCRPVSANAAAFLRMFAALAQRDAVAPARGRRRLEDFFRRLVERGRPGA